MRSIKLIALGLALIALASSTALHAGEPPVEGTEAVQKLAAEGAKAFEAGNLDAGRESFQKALGIDPNNVVVLVNLGSLEYRARHFDAAEKALKQATRLEPGTFAAWLTLGVVTLAEGKLDEALAALAQAVLIEPSNVKVHSYLGITIGRKGWLDGAESELQHAIELDDTSGQAHFNLAVIYLQRNPPAIELARRHYRRALDLGESPDSLVEKQLKGVKE